MKSKQEIEHMLKLLKEDKAKETKDELLTLKVGRTMSIYYLEWVLKDEED